MGMPNTGFIRAEGVHVSTANGSDLIQLQRLDTSIGQYAPYLITATNLLTTTPGGYTPGAVLFADAGGDIVGDSTHLSFDDTGFVLSTPNYNAGASGTAGSLSVFPPTASKGKLLFSAANSAGNTTTTITNASQAAARTYTIPDAGASASFMMTQGAQTVVGAQTFSADITASANIIANTAGKGLQIKSGSNARIGTATLSSGAVVVSNTSVTASTRIFLAVQSLGTVAVPKAIGVTAVSANTSFTITSADATDTSVVAWMLVESL